MPTYFIYLCSLIRIYARLRPSATFAILPVLANIDFQISTYLPNLRFFQKNTVPAVIKVKKKKKKLGYYTF